MGNLLLDPGNWSQNHTTPPASWNGSAYDLLSAGNGVPPLVLSSLNTGVVAFTLDVVTPTTEGGAQVQVIATPDGGSDVILYSQSVTAAGAFSFSSPPLPSATGLRIEFTQSNGYGLYAGEYVLTPTADAPVASGCFWTDFVGCAEDCEGGGES